MKEKNKNKNKKKFQFPQLTPLRLILIILVPILVAIIITIPILYITEYNSTKVTPFESDLANIDKKQIVYGNKNTIDDFNFVLYCSSYDNENGNVKFQAFAYENEKTRSIMNLKNEITIKVGMYSNWIKLEANSSSTRTRSIASGAKVALSTSKYYADFTISNVPKVPAKGKLPFVTISSIPVYAYVSYTTLINGTESTKRYVLKYEYEDYAIGRQTIFDNREKEYQVSSNNVQWRYKNDSAWTTLTSTSNLIGIQARVADGFIQWKRICDSEWANLKTKTANGDITKLSGYEEGLVPEVKIENNYIYYKFPDQDKWTNLVSTPTLQSIDVDVEDGYIVWKRWNQEEYTKLKAISELPDYTPDKTVTSNDVRISSSYIQWRYSSDSYKSLQTVDSLIGIEIQVKDSKLQWKCKDETDWKDLVLNGKVVMEYEIDTNPASYGPTSGGIY
ncbi:MAG: hypothetical protein K2N64_06605 [Anaeroplasmataceae bacterium]|nr:hypothetical protein [Anaeroplasmataceae bacterium]